MSPAAVTGDARRDALAMLAAIVAEDAEGLGAVWAGCCRPGVVEVLTLMLLGLVREQGHDPAEWIARSRELLSDA